MRSETLGRRFPAGHERPHRFPAPEVQLLASALGFDGIAEQNQRGLDYWILTVRDRLQDTYAKYPCIAYGTAWLACAHLVIAVFFIGPFLDPVRNVWVLQAGLIACVMVNPLALICEPIRGVGIKEATFVFDGGMSSQINLEAMNAAGLGYVTRLSAVTLRSLVEELALEKQLELGDRQKLKEITHEGKRYVIAGGRWRQQRDQERRQSRIDKAEAELKRLASVKRKKVDVQKLASQVGRTLPG